MTTYPWAILGVVLLAMPAAASDAPSAAPVADDFATSKKLGDEARAAGRLSEAIEHYKEALAKQDDPVVAGRLGVILFQLGYFDAAAHQLSRAVNDSSPGLSKDERVSFTRAYSDALQEVCRVEVKADRRGVRVEIDGRARGEGRVEFGVFLMPGKHTIRATLEGFVDNTQEIETERACQKTVALTMHPTPVKARRLAPFVQPSWKGDDEVERMLSGDKPVTNRVKPRSSGRFVLGVGVSVGFGMTAGVALGPQIYAAWRPRSWWEIGIDARVAWTPETAEFAAGDMTTWAVILASCGRYRERLFGCLLAQLDGGVSHFSPMPWQLVGVGPRAGIEFYLNERNRVQLFLDGVVHPKTPTFRYEKHSVWEGSVFFLTVGARAVHFF